MIFFNDIDPIAVQVGPLGIHWYGLMYLGGFVAGYWLGARRVAAGRLVATKDAYGDLMFYAMLGVILGGRIGYLLFYSHEWLRDPLMVLKVWEGGMSFHGGLLGVILATVIWSRKQQRRFWDTIDFVAPLVPIGLGLGRLGNFIGGELWGAKTNAGWGVVFPSALADLGASTQELRAMFEQGLLNAEARHPTQLYEVLFLLGLVAVLAGCDNGPSRVAGPNYSLDGDAGTQCKDEGCACEPGTEPALGCRRGHLRSVERRLEALDRRPWVRRRGQDRAHRVGDRPLQRGAHLGGSGAARVERIGRAHRQLLGMSR